MLDWSFYFVRGQIKVKKQDTDALVQALLVFLSLKKARNGGSVLLSIPLSFQNLYNICDSVKERSGACTDPTSAKAHPKDCREYDRFLSRRRPDC